MWCGYNINRISLIDIEYTGMATGNNGGHEFRQQVVSQAKKQLEHELNAGDSLYKKYHRGSGVLDVIDTD